jgi:hypothetical protein
MSQTKIEKGRKTKLIILGVGVIISLKLALTALNTGEFREMVISISTLIITAAFLFFLLKENKTS